MSVVLFPGQGSQYAGMGRELFSRFPDIVEQASDILGYCIQTQCLNPSSNQLSQTQYTQPALFTVNALHWHEHQNKHAKPTHVCGHSVGEYNALYAAGVIDFATGLKLVKQRGQISAQAAAGGMAALIGLSVAEIRQKMSQAGIFDVDIANINAQLQTVVAGPLESLSHLERLFLDGNRSSARYIPLAVSAPFHSRYLHPASLELNTIIQQQTFAEPKIDIISNIFARPYKNANEIKENLASQICCPVRWLESMEFLLENGVTHVYEAGPGNVLSTLFAKIEERHTERKRFHDKSPSAEEKNKGGVNQSPPSRQEDVAVIGMSATFPGAANVGDYWENLVAGKSSISDIPQMRCDWDTYYGDPKTEKSKTNINRAGLIEGIDEFDPLFFRLSPAEAMVIDPQQRLLLTHAWLALEDAGYPASAISGSNTAVFVGICEVGYQQLLSQADIPVEGYSSTGIVPSVAPSRISHFFNLHGPSEPVETACSSSLTAVHRAVELIRSGQCATALVGAASMIAAHFHQISFSKANMLSPDGLCKTFGADANGYVRGEGAGMLVLKSRSQAEKDGDHIYGIIKGSAVNHGGRARTLTSPNAWAQANLLTQAYRNAGISPRTINYIEAHGTGTPLGDPIEVIGLKRAFGHANEANEQLPDTTLPYCGIGSVKSNIGHLEVASGLAGFIKVLLQLKHKTLVESLNSTPINPKLKLESSPFYIVQKNQPWAPIKDVHGRALPRRAGISSFGFGGANAHVVLEEYQRADQKQINTTQIPNSLVVLSAKNVERLQERAEQHLMFLNEHNADDALDNKTWNDMIFTLQVGREEMRQRLAFTANSVHEMRSKLQSFLQGHSPTDMHQGEAPPNSAAAKDRNIESLFEDWNTESHKQQLLAAWVNGTQIDWPKLYAGHTPQRMSLPTYPFAKERYWVSKNHTASNHAVSNNVDPTHLISLKPVWTPLNAIEDQKDDTVVRALGARRALVFHSLNDGHSATLTQQLQNAVDQGLYAELLEITLPSAPDISAFCTLLEENTFHPEQDHLFWHDNPAAPESALDERLISTHPQGVEALFCFIKAVLAQNAASLAVKLSALVYDAQANAIGDTLDPAAAGIVGLMGCLAQEYPSWQVACVDLDSTLPCPDDVLQYCVPPKAFASQLVPFCAPIYRRHHWYAQHLAQIELPSPTDSQAYRDGGIYLVIGGAGGLGEAWTESIVRQHHAQVIWLGRREMCAEIDAKQEKIARLGPKPLYISADARDKAALTNAKHAIMSRFGQLNGIIHSAFVLDDHTLATMERSQFRETYSAKTDTSVRVAQVFSDLPRLDFLLFFSSIAAFSKPPGQSNYVSACCFQDTFTHLASKALPNTHVSVVNWGYWGSVGSVASAHYRQLMARRGIASIEPLEGFDRLKAFIACPLTQLSALAVMTDADASKLTPAFAGPLRFIPPISRAITSTLPLTHRQKSMTHECHINPQFIRELPLTLTPAIEPSLDEYASNLNTLNSALQAVISAVFADLGILKALAEGNTLSNICEKLAIDGYCVSWLKACFDLFDPQALIPINDTQSLWNNWRAFVSQSGHLPAHITLADTVLTHLKPVLMGETKATDILFPNGSMALFENIYKNNPSADHLNALLCRTLIHYVESCVESAAERIVGGVSDNRAPATKGNPCGLRILEIGAGTGGASAGLLKALSAYKNEIEEYCYTDLSSSFLSYGKRHFANENTPFLRFKRFDISQAPEEQGISLGQYDIVVANNVLHATANMRQTLRNTQSLLRCGGLLLVNEISDATIFTHATFGLLQGWWLHEDTKLRISGSPALSSDTWITLLKEAGFGDIHTSAAHTHELLSQQVIVALSDGCVSTSSQIHNQVSKTAETDSPITTPAHREADATRGSTDTFKAVNTASLTAEGMDVDVQAQVTRCVASVLQLEFASDAIANESFAELGVDSITGAQLIQRINAQLNIELETTDLFEFSNVARLSEHIATKYPTQLRTDAMQASNPRVIPTSHSETHASMGIEKIAAKAMSPTYSNTHTSASNHNPIDALHTHLLAMLSETLHIEASAISLDAPFADYGLDSISGTELIRKLNESLNISLDSTSLFEHTNAGILCSHIVDRYDIVLPEKDQKNPTHADVPTPEKRTPEKQIPEKQIVTEDKPPTSQRNSIQLMLQKALIPFVAETLEVPTNRIDAHDTFAEYGLDSISGTRFIHRVNAWLNIQLDATVLYDFPSIAELCLHISDRHAHALAPLLHEPASDALASNANEENFATSEEKSSITASAPTPTPTPSFSTTPSSKTPSNKTPSSKVNGTPNTQASERAQDTSRDIAIVGMSGRFAGAKNLEAYWTHLANGDDLVSDITRWDMDEYYQTCLPPNGQYCKQGGLLDDIDQFDHRFFAVSAIEAAHTDPQQRLFLQEAWHALECAGYAGHTHSNKSEKKNWGVYVGCAPGTYQQLVGEHAPPQAFWGNANSILAARIAYFLDLQGPAIAVDTACSSSLVAIHLACQSLWQRETDMAIAGGVFVMSTPEFYKLANRASMLSPDGKCHTFDHRANGFVPGEGAGAIIVKRFDDAISDGDNILGVIKGTGLNQDGASNGITAPSTGAQEDLERKVYTDFAIHPDSIDMVEAHGTGTQLGDPIEMKALTRTYRAYTQRHHYCAIGSVKSNIGHTAAAAGIAGVLKILLSLKHSTIPASLHFQEKNKHIDYDNSPFYVNTQNRAWPESDTDPRRAAISSFGFSGTNVHMVFEQAPKITRTDASNDLPATACIVILSAQTREQLNTAINNLADWCSRQGNQSDHPHLLADLSFTLATGRTHLAQRFACVASSLADLRQQLHFFGNGTHDEQSLSQHTIFIGDALSQDSQERRKRYVDQLGAEEQRMLEHTSGTGTGFSAAFMKHMAQLFTLGHEIDLDRLFDGNDHRRIELPSYPFAPFRHWVNVSKNDKFKAVKDPSHKRLCTDVKDVKDLNGSLNRPLPLLGEQTNEDGHIAYCSAIDLTTPAFQYLRGHKVNNTVWLPGAALIELAIEAMEHAHDEKHDQQKTNTDRGDGVYLENVQFSHPVQFEKNTQQLTILISEEPNQKHTDPAHNFVIRSPLNSAPNRQTYASGRAVIRSIRSGSGLLNEDLFGDADVNAFMRHADEQFSSQTLYRRFQALGLDYTGPFQGIEHGWRRGDDALVQLKSFDATWSDTDNDRYRLFPPLLDSIFQSACVAGLRIIDEKHATLVPSSMASMECFTTHIRSAKWVRCTLRKHNDRHTWFDFWVMDDEGRLLILIKGLCVTLLQKTASPVVTHVASNENTTLWKMEWKQFSMAASPSANASNNRWLILGGSPEISALLTSHIENENTVTVIAAAKFAHLSPREYTIHPGSKSHWQTLLQHAFAGLAPTHIVHMWAMESPSIDDLDTLKAAQALCCDSVLHLVQTLSEVNQGAHPQPKISLISSGCQATADSREVTHPEQSLLWGFGVCAQQEHPELNIRLIDIEGQNDGSACHRSTNHSPSLPDLAAALWIALQPSNDDTENRLALRLVSDPSAGVDQPDYEYRVPRLSGAEDAFTPIAHNSPIVIDPDKAYLITGGLGDLASVVAQSLLSLGARHLILVARRSPSAERIDTIEHLRASGTRVDVVLADLTDKRELHHALAAYRPANSQGAIIGGIIHTAGVLRDASLMNLNPDAIFDVLAPKVIAPVLLQSVATEVDFFIHFSSITSLFGAFGQTAYGAANAYLDALAHHHSQVQAQAQQGMMSVNWGPWAEVGMVSKDAKRIAAVTSNGLIPLSNDEGTNAFQNILAYALKTKNSRTTHVRAPSSAQLAAVMVTSQARHSGAIPLFNAVAPKAANPLAVSRDAPTPQPTETQSTATQPTVIDRLRLHVAEITEGSSQPEATAIDASIPLKELGMDSLMLSQLRNHIRSDFALEVDLSTLMSLATITDIADHIDAIRKEHAEGTTQQSGANAPQTADINHDRNELDTIEYQPATRDILRMMRTEHAGVPSTAHHLGLAVILKTVTTAEQLESFLMGVVNRHAALRLAIEPAPEDHARYRLAIHRQLSTQLTGRQLLTHRQLPTDADIIPEAKQLLKELMAVPFDFQKPPLWRFQLVETVDSERNETKQVLLFGAHHAVSDFQSLLIFMTELEHCLDGKILSQRISNQDIDLWLRAQHAEQLEADANDGWADTFTGCKRLNLTLSSPRPESPSYRQGIKTLRLTGGLFDDIQQQCSALAVTPAALCLSSFNLLLAHLSQQKRFAVAVPVDTRAHVDGLDAFGFFGVPVPLAFSINGSETLQQFLDNTDQQFHRVLKQGTAISDALPALFTAGLAQQGAPLIEAYFNYIRPGFNTQHIEPLDSATGQFDVDLMVIFSAAMGSVSVYYSKDIIDENTADIIANTYLTLLEKVCEILRKGQKNTTLNNVPVPQIRTHIQSNNDTSPKVCGCNRDDSIESAASVESVGDVETVETVETVESTECSTPHTAQSKPKENYANKPTANGVTEVGAIALAASFSVGHLPMLLTASHEQIAHHVNIVEAPYHQVLAALLDPHGVFHHLNLDSAVVLIRSEDLTRFTSLTDEQLTQCENEYYDALMSLNGRIKASLLVGFLPSSQQSKRFDEWDTRLSVRLKRAGLNVVTSEQWTQHYPVDERFDATANEVAHLPFTSEFQSAIALTLTRKLWQIKQPLLKVVAVDGDNTLWHGVAGELGCDAVDLSGPYKRFAQKLLALHAAGVLLVLISKNDENTLLDVLKRKDSLLNATHFAAISHGWEGKAMRLQQCIKTLNLGLDSVAFLDDNPVEIAEMRSVLPQVSSYQVPAANELDAFMAHLWRLDIDARVTTQEDKARANFYRIEAQRQTLKENTDFETFIANLELQIDYTPINNRNCDRTMQLSARTNQFVMHHTPLNRGAIDEMLENGREIWAAKVKDRFGEYGQVCVLIVQHKGTVLEVQNWLLSCRVLGRSVEDRILQWLTDLAEQRGCHTLAFSASNTSRNIPARRLVAALSGEDVDSQHLRAELSIPQLRQFRYIEFANASA